MELSQAPTPTALWQELVAQAAKTAGCSLDETQESHLVFLLMRHIGQAHIHSQAVGVQYLRTMHERRGAPADVGDQCLLLAGLFPRYADRWMGVEYYCRIGSSAYMAEAERTRRAMAEVFEHLAHTFWRLVRVLVHVRAEGRRQLTPFSMHAMAMGDVPGDGHVIAWAKAPRQVM